MAGSSFSDCVPSLLGNALRSTTPRSTTLRHHGSRPYSATMVLNHGLRCHLPLDVGASIHPDTMRSVCHFHNSAASTKRHHSYQALVSVRRTHSTKRVSPRREFCVEARLRRGAAMIPPTASQRRPAMVSRWVRLGNRNSLRPLPFNTCRRLPKCVIQVNARVFRYVCSSSVCVRNSCVVRFAVTRVSCAKVASTILPKINTKQIRIKLRMLRI